MNNYCKLVFNLGELFNMSDYEGNFFVFKSLNGESSKIKINYSFSDSCLLGESQLNIY